MRLCGIVSRITDVSEGWHAHAHRRGKERYQVLRDQQLVRGNTHAAINETVEQSGSLIKSLLDFRGALQPFCLEGADIKSIVIKRGEAQGKVLLIKPSRSAIAD